MQHLIRTIMLVLVLAVISKLVSLRKKSRLLASRK